MKDKKQTQNTIARKKECKHYMCYQNLGEGYWFYRCMNCDYIDGKETFKDYTPNTEVQKKLEEEAREVYRYLEYYYNFEKNGVGDWDDEDGFIEAYKTQKREEVQGA